MSPPTPKYAYTPLNPDTQEIRLIILEPSTSLIAPVVASTTIVSLLSKQRYEAISYCWGDPKITAPIALDNVLVDVTTNLETALRYFRLDYESRILWADAICINQSDIQEKNIQVGMMGEIYTACTKCLAWIGEDNEGDGKATFAMLEDIANGGSIPMEACKPHSIEHENAKLQNLYRFMRRPYWSRIWVVQETVLPPDVEYWCGRSKISRQFWVGARTSAAKNYPALFIEAQISQQCSTCQSAFNDWTSEGATSLVHMTLSVSSAGIYRYIAADSLFTIASLRHLKCQNSLDKVYALYALMTPEYRAAITIDYSYHDLTKLAVQLVRADIEQSKEFRVLGSVEYFRENRMNFSSPSWWPDLDWRSGSPGDYHMKGHMLEWERTFSASGDSKPTVNMEYTESGVLGVTTVLFDVVQYEMQLHTLRDFMLTRKMLALLLSTIKPLVGGDTPEVGNFACPYPGGGTFQDAWWRTILSDHVFNEDGRIRRTVPSDEEIFENTLKTLPDVSSSYPDFMSSALLFEQVNGPAGYWMLQFMSFVSRERSWFVTWRGYIGMGPLATRPGDEIHIVAGSRLPLLLRRVNDSREPMPADKFICLGKCYVHGIMDGEAAGNFEENATWIDLI